MVELGDSIHPEPTLPIGMTLTWLNPSILLKLDGRIGRAQMIQRDPRAIYRKHS
jgi:hypothetical protein